MISISLDEEETLDLAGTVHWRRDPFDRDRDRATKRFCDHFTQAHTAFLDLIKGITDQRDVERGPRSAGIARVMARGFSRFLE